MDKELIMQLNRTFEECTHQQNGIEFWFARELQELLGYSEWRNFLNIIAKAKDSFISIGEEVSDHFADVNKMVQTLVIIGIPPFIPSPALCSQTDRILLFFLAFLLFLKCLNSRFQFG